MFRKAVCGVMLFLLLIGVFSLAVNIKPVKSEWTGTVYIRADGSIDPPDAPIITYDKITYTLTDNITSSGDGIIVERDNIVIDGAGYTIQGTGAYQSKGIDLSGRTNVTVKNAQIQNFHCGVYLLYSSNNTISGNKITNNGCGVFLDDSSNYNSIIGNNIANNNYDGVGLWLSSNNSICGNRIKNNKRGIGLDRSSYNIVSGNNITNNGSGTGLCDSSNHNSVSGNTFTNDGLVVWDSYHNVVKNNTINGKLLVYLEGVVDYSVGDAGQVILVNCSRIRVENLNLSRTSIGVELWKTNNSVIIENNITNNNYGVVLGYSHNNIISGNNITANNGDGVYLCGSSNNTISENLITNSFHYGVYLTGSSNYNSISENLITNNSLYGVGLCGSSNNIISGNIITGTNYYGIWLGLSSNNCIIGNNIANNNYDGVGLSDSSGNSVSGNNITANGYGVELYQSYNNIISGNNITANNYYGVWLDHSPRNSIVENNIANNNHGIGIRWYSSNNWIYHNNFIDNGVQVYSFLSINVWDDYPSGGNYWSDYAGVDYYSGPYQNITGSDGIGDTPYVIDENNIDHYPLMNPYTPTPPKPPIVNATVDVNPKTLNLRSRGKWITAYIELPEGYNVADINVSSILLNDTISAELRPIAIGDYDNDSIPDLMVKFDRAKVIGYILNNVDLEQLFVERFMTVTLTVTGYLNDGTPFQGTDTIRIIYFTPRIWRFIKFL